MNKKRTTDCELGAAGSNYGQQRQWLIRSFAKSMASDFKYTWDPLKNSSSILGTSDHFLLCKSIVTFFPHIKVPRGSLHSESYLPFTASLIWNKETVKYQNQTVMKPVCAPLRRLQSSCRPSASTIGSPTPKMRVALSRSPRCLC